MPEGDTIYRAARTLHRALAGHQVVAFSSMYPALTRVHDDAPLTGRTIEQVRAAGKHLLIILSGGLVLRTHMRMNGSWHIYRRGEAWQRPRRDMRIVIATDTFEAVGFNIPVAEFITAAALERHQELRRLGPDLLADDFDETEAIARVRARSAAPIADVLLNQRVLAGIGNVYKSEVLFACRVNPFARVGDLEPAQIERIVRTARTFLRINVSESLPLMTTYAGYRRTTRRDDPGERLWVYGRGRLPCRRCGTAIAVSKDGRDARLTYWCPTCQTDAAANAVSQR
jgi:endonuclease VIII